jgi:hypothetical protein
VKGESTSDVCAVQRSSYLQSGFFFVFPDLLHSLVSSRILGTQNLWRLKSVCRQLPRFANRIVLLFRAAIIYIVFCSFIFYPTLAASPSNVSILLQVRNKNAKEEKLIKGGQNFKIFEFLTANGPKFLACPENQ